MFDERINEARIRRIVDVSLVGIKLALTLRTLSFWRPHILLSMFDGNLIVISDVRHLPFNIQ